MALEGLQSLIQGLEKQASWETRRQFRQVINGWPKTVGYLIARQTRPVSIQRQVLYVAVASSAWAQTLTFERSRILKKLNPTLPSPLKDIRFSPALWSHRPPSRIANPESALAHPSYLPPMARQAVTEITHAAASAARSPLSADAAFQRWAGLIQTQHSGQPICPTCRCPCPPGELERWQVCALCAAKTWKTTV
jgi:predicted nucleic acid-binding Zn ribbon protein